MTPKEQIALEKRQRLVIKGTCNRLISRFSLREVRTWEDVYRMTGYDEKWIAAQSNVKSAILIVELREYCKNLQENFEKSLHEKHEIKPTEVTEGPRPSNENVADVQPVESKTTPPVTQAITIAPTQQAKDNSNTLDETGFNNSSDYGLIPSFNERAFLFWFQKKCVKESLDKIIGLDISQYASITELSTAFKDPNVIKCPKSAILIIATTGTGKTFIQNAIDRRLIDLKFADDKTWGHIKRLSITRNSVVEQTKRVAKNLFGIDPVIETEVLNIEKLRTRAGQLWIEEKHIIVNGEEAVVWSWKPIINPAVLYLDECQSVKNAGTTQHNIIVSYSDLPNTTQVYISASPFTRVSEAKAFAIATHADISHLGFPSGTKLSSATWNTYASAIAHPSAPDEYNEAAVERLMKDLDDYIVRVKGVRWQFNAINSVEIIDFQNAQQEKEYNDAWLKYLEKKAKLEETVTDNPRFQKMIALGLFLAAAEYAKREIFAQRMYHDVQEGYAAVCAVKFKKTIIAVTKILVERYGVPRDQISLIWGGGQTQLTAKQKLKAQVNANKDIFEQAGITMADMCLDEVEDRVLEDLPPELRLGNQSKEQRQNEIDRFQSGKSSYCMYTYKAGGVGLSLHHTDEMTKQKVRRQKNGYAVVEDIPNIPTRPRKVTVGPTWSPIELVQGVGRVPRLTSLSNTIQHFLYFRGTVEEDQAFVVTHRLKCLSKVVRQRENWQDIIENHTKARELARAKVEEYQKFETDDPQIDINPNLGEEEED